MTLKQRIRYLTDGLRAGCWLSFADIRERLPGEPYDSIATALGQMYRSEQLRRRGSRKCFEYRSGRRPVVAKKRGRAAKAPEQRGFMALARLRESDPAAYAKAVAVDRRRA